MAEFQIHLSKRRTFTLTPTLDGVPKPGTGASPVFTSSNPAVFELSAGPGGEFTTNGKLLVVDNANLSWTYVTASGVAISGSETILGLDTEPNGGVVEASPEF